MVSSISTRAFAALALLCAATASAQEIQQLLKDVWVATPARPHEVNFESSTLDPIAGTFGTIRAMAFEPPQLGYSGAGRSLIFVDGTVLRRFADDAITFYYDPGKSTSGAPDLSAVHTVAVTDDGTALFSGFSRRKKVYELWAYKGGTARLRATGTPQLTDAVYLSAEDVSAAGLGSTGGGYLAATAKAIMFFPEPSAGWMSEMAPTSPAPLADATRLGLKGNTALQSVDVVRGTGIFMFATSDRQLFTTYTLTPATPSQPAVLQTRSDFDLTVPKPCTSKTTLLLVRNLSSGTDATSVVSDSCGRVLPYAFNSTDLTPVAKDGDPAPIPSGSLVSGLAAIAVGEGNVVACPPNMEACQLTSGAKTRLESTTPREVLVLEYVLCDPRVAGCDGPDTAVDDDNFLNFNLLLPQGLQDALKFGSGPGDDVTITIPPYMFGAGPDGRFGALIVQSTDPLDSLTAVKATIELEIGKLLGFELGTRSAGNTPPDSFVRGEFDGDETSGEGDDPARDRAEMTLALLNQDIVAYAPDDPDFETVRGFEATPVTTGSFNPLYGGLRGFSVVMYGLQHDVNKPDRPRKDPIPGQEFSGGGIPFVEDLAGAGGKEWCHLEGVQDFDPQDLPERFYINLAACLFADQETLLGSVIADSDFLDFAGGYSAKQDELLSRLANVRDKLIKALNAAGPNTGSTDLQAVLSQLLNYRSAVVATQFQADSIVYKNELLVRADAFKFLLVERAYPSLPIGGFPQ